MARLIDADKCHSYFYDHLDEKGMVGAMNAVEEMPTIDAVEVVRCKDCKCGMFTKFRKGNPVGMICTHKNMFPLRVAPEFYCAYGAKMDAEVEG